MEDQGKGLTEDDVPLREVARALRGFRDPPNETGSSNVGQGMGVGEQTA